MSDSAEPATCGCGDLSISGGTAELVRWFNASPGSGWTELSEFDVADDGTASDDT